jgi:hypothetical protein
VENAAYLMLLTRPLRPTIEILLPFFFLTTLFGLLNLFFSLFFFLGFDSRIVTRLHKPLFSFLFQLIFVELHWN